MARGWESKAVADQIEDEKHADNTSRHPGADHSLEARLKGERLHSLRLSKSRLLQQLERATHPAHRTVLENGLKAIEAEIEQLGKP